MPNHVSNKLRVEGDPDEVAALFASVVAQKDGGEFVIDFERIDPMPDILKNVVVGVRTFDGVRVTRWWSDRDDEGFGTADDSARLLTDADLVAIAATGAANWLSWSWEHWGTKWGAYGCRSASPESVVFHTAWSAPVPAMRTLSRRFPALTLFLTSADEEITGWGCEYIIKDGVVVGEHECEGADAARLWFKVNDDCVPGDLGYDPETFERVPEFE